MQYWELETIGPYYQMIAEGVKKFELRAPDKASPKKDYTKIKKGDAVNIIQVADFSFVRMPHIPPISCKVLGKTTYDKVESVFKDFDFKLLNPIAESVEEVITTTYSFPGYIDRINEYGVVLIELSIIVS